jgi:hypothetical protein
MFFLTKVGISSILKVVRPLLMKNHKAQLGTYVTKTYSNKEGIDAKISYQ